MLCKVWSSHKLKTYSNSQTRKNYSGDSDSWLQNLDWSLTAGLAVFKWFPKFRNSLLEIQSSFSTHSEIIVAGFWLIRVVVWWIYSPAEGSYSSKTSYRYSRKIRTVYTTICSLSDYPEIFANNYVKVRRFNWT